MTSLDFMEALNGQGIETTVDKDGVVTMLLNEAEYRKRRKYENIVKQTGWKRSWGRKVKECTTD